MDVAGDGAAVIVDNVVCDVPIGVVVVVVDDVAVDVDNDVGCLVLVVPMLTMM